MPNAQFHLNKQEIIDVSTKLNCTNNKIGSVLKASLLDRKNSPDYRNLTPNVSEKDISDEIRKAIIHEEKDKIIDEYLSENDFPLIMDRKTKLEMRTKFTPLNQNTIEIKN